MKCLFSGLSAIVVFTAIVALPVVSVFAQNNNHEFELQDFDFWSEQCLLLTREREYEKALEACEKAISLRPNSSNQIWLARADVLSHLSRYPEALISLERAIAAEPKNSLAIAQQCAIFYQLGRINEALDACDRALQVNGNWGDRSPSFAWYYRGLALRDMGRLETALNSFDRARSLDANDPLIIAGRCETLADLGILNPPCGLREAITAYERALTVTPGKATLWVQQGLVLEQSGAFERALTAYENAIKINARSSLALARRCGVLNHLKNYAAALESCTSAFQGDERWGWQGASALFRRCEVWQQSQQQDAQQNQQQNQRQLQEQLKQDQQQLPQQLRQQNALPPLCNELLEEQNSAEPRQFGSAFAWNQQSIALAGLGRYEEALASADRAIAIDPYYPSAWNSKAVSLWGLQQNREARIAIERSLKLYNRIEQLMAETFERVYPEPLLVFFRGKVIAYFNQGRIEASLRNYALAVQSYDDAFQLGIIPRDSGIAPASDALLSDIRLNQGAAYLQLGKTSEALAATDNAIALANNNTATGFYNRGLILVRMGDYQRAFNAYSRADKLSPNNPQIATGQAIALEGLARQCPPAATVADVLAAYDRAIELDSNSAVAQQRRSNLLDSLNGQINRPLSACSANNT